MSERESMGLKGSVRELVVESSVGSRETWSFDRAGRVVKQSWSHPKGGEGSREFRYDEDGVLIDPFTRRTVVEHEDGGRTEIETLPPVENLYWAKPPQFRGTGFQTRGATTVEIDFDPRGFISRCVFYDDSREVTTRVEFKTDEYGIVTENTVFSGVRPAMPLPWYHRLLMRRSDKRKLAGLLRPGEMVSRTSYRLDGSGRVAEQQVFTGGSVLVERTIFTYNEHGDKLTEAHSMPESGTAYMSEIEYEYDDHGNWTRQTVRSRGGSDQVQPGTHCEVGSNETRRSFTYYE